ncbi:MAG: hypothetical protein HY973_00330 [Candidatus Kerfeldbacteria bacterium]|nr:hypothetical protein [Candidatus Kerfeldbacteria bacterium]
MKNNSKAGKGLNHLLKDSAINPVAVKENNQILISPEGKVIGNSDEINNLGLTITSEKSNLFHEYLSAVKEQITEDEFSLIKFNYRSLLPKNWNNNTYLDFTNIIVHKKPVKLENEQLVNVVTSPEFWDYVNLIRKKLQQGLKIKKLREILTTEFYTIEELKNLILDEFTQIAIDSILTKGLELDNLLNEAVALGASDQEIHFQVLEKIWKDPIIKFYHNNGIITEKTVEKYQN